MFRLVWSVWTAIWLLGTGAHVQAATPPYAVPYRPVMIPLGIKAPYVGTYLQGRWEKNLARMDPVFWAGGTIGWSGYIRVDGETWRWMGSEPASDNVTVLTDSYSTTFGFQAGGTSELDRTVELTAEFISPITPDEPLFQSIPFAYITLSVKALDGNPHSIELYTDIDGTFTTDVVEDEIEWSTLSDREDYVAHRVSLTAQRAFSEHLDRSLYGSVWYAAKQTDGIELLHSAGANVNDSRAQFVKTGALLPDAPSRPTKIRAKTYTPVFALAHSFSIEPEVAPPTVTLAVGHIRGPQGQYMSGDATNRGEFGVGPWGGGGTVLELEHYWTTRYADGADMLGSFFASFDHALAKSRKFNEKLYKDATKAVDVEYAHTLAVSTRQIFLALEYVVSPFEQDEYMIMLKEISSNGNCQTIDVINPMLPFLMYAAPHLLPPLLEPIYRYVRTGLYLPIPPPHDIGEHFPNATGRNAFLHAGLPLEETGNMLNMAYAAALSSEAGMKQARRYYDMFETWANWIVTDGEFPGHQRSTDDFFGPASNQTSLVIKGLTGLKSFAEIARLNRDTTNAMRYDRASAERLESLLKYGMSTDGTHLTGTYGNDTSWFMHYNMYYDRLLQLDLFSEKLYTLQDAWYDKHMQPFGVPLDSRNHKKTKTDWMAWTAAASRTGTRAKLLTRLGKYLRQEANWEFGDLMEVDGGWSVGFLVRPVVGGHFSVLGLNAMHDMMRRRKSLFPIPNLPVSWGDVKDTLKEIKEKPAASGFSAVVFLLTLGALWYVMRKVLGAMRGKNRYSAIASDNNDFSLPDIHSPRVEPVGVHHGRRASSVGHLRRASCSRNSSDSLIEKS